MVRREHMYTFLASMAVTRKGTSSQRRFVNQDTVVNIIREYLVVNVERFLPHLHEELVRTTKWAQWQAGVVDCMNLMRDSPPSPSSAFKMVLPKTVPSKFVYTIEKQSFIDALDTECISFLDTGRRRRVLENVPDGSETPMDAPLLPEVDHVLRTLVNRYRHDVAAPPLMPTMRVPTNSMTDDDIQREFIDCGRVPLLLFHATPSVVSEYVAAAINYEKSPSPGVTKALVYYLVKNTSMYQLQLVHAFVRAQIDARNIRTFPLPTHIANAQARVVRTRLGLTDDSPIPLGALESFVCLQCREFRGVLIAANDDAPNELPMHGSENVAFASSSINQQVAERLRADGFPSWRRLLIEGRRHQTLFKYYQENAFIDGDTRIYPHDPTLFDAPPSALSDAQEWLVKYGTHKKNTFTFDYDDSSSIPNTAAAAAVPEIPRFPSPPPIDQLITAPFVETNTHEEFLHRWQKRNGQPFVIGHRPSDEDLAAGAPIVVWTCASKRYKNEERKTRQVASAMHRVSDSITEQERMTALRSANTRRRHDVRLFYERTLCSRLRVAAVSLLGMALRLDNMVILACCMCTGFTTTNDMHWHDGVPVCTRCWRRVRAGDTIDPAAMGVSAAVKCRQCRAPRRASEQYMSVTVYDDVSERFVLVHLCPRHSKKKLWVLNSPNYHSLSTIDAGISGGWQSLRSWQTDRDYLRVRANEDVEQLLAVVEGHEHINDDDDNDDDDVVTDDDSSITTIAATTTTTTTVVESKKRRRVAADSRQNKALVVK
jgi:hypothetical protein